jgi:CheY-like chemotaxis protein
LAISLGEANALLAQRQFDAALLDLSLPDSNGLETIGRLAATEPRLPIVVLSGVADAEIVPQAVRCGAQDYLLKGRSRLQQIIRNLIDNAVKFTHHGEVALEVTLESASSQDLTLHFVVRDTGIGIPKDKQATIFGMFEQADSSLARSHGGAGLGLAITSQLVRFMGGRFWLESQFGVGSRFHFTIRLDGVPADAVPAIESPPPVKRQPRTKLRVLLAEHSLVNQRLLAGLLNQQGHTVILIENELQLLVALESEEYDLMLLDIQMPQINADEVAAKIRAKHQQTGTHIPVIGLTAHTPEHGSEQCLPGIDAYLTTPIRPEELFEVISRTV